MPDQATAPTAERVHAIALRLFARQGYEATTLGQIADAVGIRKPSLYNHIDSKEALFLTLVESVEARFFEIHDASMAASESTTAPTRLRALVEELSGFIFAEDQGSFYKRFLLFPPDTLRSAMRDINARSEARINAALEMLHDQGVAEGHWPNLACRVFIDAFYCLMDGLYTERFIYDPAEYRRRLDSAWTVFIAGLVAQGAQRG